MDETRRFLRYVVPTLVFLTEVAVLLLLTQERCLIGSVSSKLRTGGAGFAALLLVMAGGLGYFFSLVHHTLFWYCEKYGIDYREFVRAALDHGWLRLVTYGERTNVARERVNRIVAWDVVALLWYRPGKTGDATAPEIGATLVSRSDAISDLMHSIGTSVIAAWCVGPAWGVLYFWLCHEPISSSRLGPVWSVLLTLPVWAVFVCLHCSNYKRVRNYLVRLVKNVLATHFTHVGKPSVIFVDHSALNPDLGTTRNLSGKIRTAFRTMVERFCKQDSTTGS
jgi:hypothetical protein